MDAILQKHFSEDMIFLLFFFPPDSPLAALDLTANDKLYTGTRHLYPYHHLLTVDIVADSVVIIIGILSTLGLKM